MTHLKPSTRETTGAGGVRYYMLREIVGYNNAKKEVQDSKLGGARFEIYLQKAGICLTVVYVRILVLGWIFFENL